MSAEAPGLSGQYDESLRRLQNVKGRGPTGFAGLPPNRAVPVASALTLAQRPLSWGGTPAFLLTFLEATGVTQVDHYNVYAGTAGVSPTHVAAVAHSPCIFAFPCAPGSSVQAYVQTVLLSGAHSPFLTMPCASCLAGGALLLGATNSATATGSLANGQINVWIDDVGNNLKFQVKYASGTVKNGSVALV